MAAPIDGIASRHRMVDEQVAARGVHDPRVLAAMREVPREAFVAPGFEPFAYADSALPIESDQTISQPFIVAVMAAAMEIGPGDRVLEVGTGSGYAAAVLSRVAAEVFTVERHAELANLARERFARLGYDNVHVRVGDGTLGWPEAAPFDAIGVAAGGPAVPPALLQQLGEGGRLIIPTGPERSVQTLLRVRRTDGAYVEEGLGPVRFVPLVGEGGWAERSGRAEAPPREPEEVISAAAIPFDAIEDADVEGILARAGAARVVLLGEATHGTSEFYRMRARITRALIEREGFRIVAVEADWPDAAHVNAWVRGEAPPASPARPFERFPTWMWRNREVLDFAAWLRDRNDGLPEGERAGFYGLDLYSLFGSIGVVLDYLDDVDPEAAAVARFRYGCLTPWQADPAIYGQAVAAGRYRECEDDVAANLVSLLRKRLDYESRSGAKSYFDAATNARLAANAEQYYRAMYQGGTSTWNLRDSHMFETLESLLRFHGSDARAVVWEHNSHVGDARATEMGARGEHNVGQLARARFGDDAYLVGFGTHAGAVAAAHDWGGPMHVMKVVPSLEGSYERLCHEADPARFTLPLRAAHAAPGIRRALEPERLERAIGVIYRPASERWSHYFSASLPRQFDEYIWFDRSAAVTPTAPTSGRDDRVPDTFPFGV